jgi:hypothetical protein
MSLDYTVRHCQGFCRQLDKEFNQCVGICSMDVPSGQAAYDNAKLTALKNPSVEFYEVPTLEVNSKLNTDMLIKINKITPERVMEFRQPAPFLQKEELEEHERIYANTNKASHGDPSQTGGRAPFVPSESS